MNPTSMREALVAEAIGEAGRLLDRIETLLPALDRAQVAMMESHAALEGKVAALEARVADLTEAAKTTAVDLFARRASVVAKRSLDAQIRAMTEAARVLFEVQANPTLQRLVESLQRLAERCDRRWEFWSTHAATAAISAAVTGAVTFYVLRP